MTPCFIWTLTNGKPVADILLLGTSVVQYHYAGLFGPRVLTDQFDTTDEAWAFAVRITASADANELWLDAPVRYLDLPDAVVVAAVEDQMDQPRMLAHGIVHVTSLIDHDGVDL